ncbi:MAG: hypothetical protein K8M05_08230 [Deltaproteobacteria bacterium]|nr:hypothetical protein [Kofleriaceae bacterium]
MLPSPYDRRWLLRWILGSTLAYVLGGGAAVAVVAGAYQLGLVGGSPLLALLVGGLAGLVAGLVIGALEAVLLPATVSRSAWIRGTTAGAVIVWILVAVTPALLVTDPAAPAQPMFARVALAMCVGGSAGMLLAAFQAPVLAVLAVRTRPWLLGNGAAWGTATPVTYAVTGAPSSPAAAVLSALVLLATAGLAGGATTAFTLLLEERRAQLIGQSTGRTCATELV